MKDPYEVLGVKKNATNEEIKRAYRKRARQAHPDRGGDVEVMKDLTVAYALLSDPLRRQRYDSGGNTDVTHSIEAQAKARLCALLLQAIQADQELDLIASMRQTLDADMAGVAAARAQMVKLQAKFEKRLKRLKGPDDSFLHYAVKTQIQACLEKIAQGEQAKQVIELCIELLKPFSYEVDQAARQSFRPTIGPLIFSNSTSFP